MRFKLKRVTSTLLFGLVCSIITALHISSRRLPNGESRSSDGRSRDQKVARDSRPVPGGPGAAPGAGPVPVVPVDAPGRQNQKQSLGVRLQREMAWAADDSSLADYNLQQKQQQVRPKNVDFRLANKTSIKHSAHPDPPLPDKTVYVKSGSQTVAVLPKIPSKIHKGANSSKDEDGLAQTELADIFIGVKTTGANHKNRVQLILDTWLPLAPEQTYFFTDRDDPHYQQVLGDHLINTKCPPLHSRHALCCKVAIIYDTFLDSGKRWFCQLDDDNYLNVLNLVNLLRGYSHKEDLYLGRASLSHPIQALDRDKGFAETSFWFATGGAGFCISRSLALKMVPLASGGQFTYQCNRVRLPDDVAMGFVIDGLLKVPLTKLDLFNSHLQGLGRLAEAKLHNQVTLSYYISPARNNTIALKNTAFSKEQDPTRLRSLHCMLYPNSPKCP